MNRKLKTIFSFFFPECARKLRAPVSRVIGVIKAAYAPVERAEKLFLQMNNLSTMIGQVGRVQYFSQLSIVRKNVVRIPIK